MYFGKRWTAVSAEMSTISFWSKHLQRHGSLCHSEPNLKTPGWYGRTEQVPGCLIHPLPSSHWKTHEGTCKIATAPEAKNIHEAWPQSRRDLCQWWCRWGQIEECSLADAQWGFWNRALSQTRGSQALPRHCSPGEGDHFLLSTTNSSASLYFLNSSPMRPPDTPGSLEILLLFQVGRASSNTYWPQNCGWWPSLPLGLQEVSVSLRAVRKGVRGWILSFHSLVLNAGKECHFSRYEVSKEMAALGKGRSISQLRGKVRI